MELFDYLMAKKGHNTGGDLFSYLLGKNAGGSGTYTTFSGITLNIASTLRAKIKNFMLNSTELTQDGTPSPSSPVDVNVIKGKNNVKVGNKNLFDKDTAVYKNGYYKDSSGNEVTTSISGYTSSYTKVKPNTTYTISGSIRTINANSAIYCYTNSKNWISRINWTGEDNTSFTFTTPNNCYYIQFQYTQEVINGDTVQLEEGSTATEYVEHQEQNYPITLGSLEYCKIGNYADQISNQFESKNLFNIDDFVTQMSTPFNVTTQDGVVTITRKANTTYDYPLNCKENTQYTLSMDLLNIASSSYYIRFKYSDGTYSDIVNLEGYADFTKITATSTTNKTLTAINFQLYGFNNNIKIKNIQLEIGSTASEYMPYGITKGEWYLKKNIGKIDSYNGETITTSYISTTGGLDTGATVYYGLATPTYIHISETDYPILRSQLENLYNNAESYKEQTNITQTNDDLPFNISVDVKVLDTNLNMNNSLNSSLLSNNLQNEEETNLSNTNEIDEIEEPIEEHEEL